MNDIVKKDEITMVERLTLDERVDPEKLQAIINMQYQAEDRQNEKEFIKAMVACQIEMPAIKKETNNNQTHSLYAKVEKIKRIIKPIYTKHGFAITFHEGEARKEDHIRIIANVMHISGYSKEYYYDNPVDMTGIKGQVNKTETHGKASGVSYAERYLLKLIFNLELHDEDDDGNAAGNPYITEEQAKEITDMLVKTESDADKFLEYFKFISIEAIPAPEYNKVITTLRAKQAKQ